MEEKSISRMIKTGSQRVIQQNLFGAPDPYPNRSKFISIYRITLVKDTGGSRRLRLIRFGQ